MSALCHAHAHDALRSVCVDDKMAAVVESLILSGLLRSPNKRGMSIVPSAVRAVPGVCAGIAHASCRGAARANTLDPAKMLVFLSRCSNPNAVFAIPAGTSRHRHSLTARRAAWRRSERRRRNQRRRRARARQRRAGRRSKVLAASSLRLRTTSLTASHGPA